MYDATKHFESLYAATPAEFGFQAETRGEWLAWQEAFRPRLRAALGLDTMAADLAGHLPRAEQVGAVDLDDHIRESWHLWVEPTVPLPFYLLRPKEAQGPLPLVLTPHGHNHPHIYAGIANSESELASMQAGERDIAVQAVREGYLAIAPTTRAFGETRTAADAAEDKVHSCRTQLMHDLLVGRTPIGERVWDISRLIDWALETPAGEPSRYSPRLARRASRWLSPVRTSARLPAVLVRSSIVTATTCPVSCAWERCTTSPGWLRHDRSAPLPARMTRSSRLRTCRPRSNACSGSTRLPASQMPVSYMWVTKATATTRRGRGPLCVSILAWDLDPRHRLCGRIALGGEGRAQYDDSLRS